MRLRSRLQRLKLPLFLFFLSNSHVWCWGEAPLGPVFIQEPPHRVDFLNSTGSSVLCSAHGNPTPVIHWMLADGTRVDDIPGMRKILHNGTLVFVPFPAEDYDAEIHSAVYLCVAANEVGRIVSRKVHVRAVVKQYYEVQVYDEYVINGNTAVLKCHIPSFVRDYVIVTSWLRGNKQRITSDVETGGRYSVFTTGELHIRHVDYSDGGPVPYRCETRHTLTGETWVSGMAGKVIVTDPQSSVPPRVTDTRSVVSVRQKEPVEIPCAAQGYPVPTYEWFLKQGDDEDAVQLELGGRLNQVSGSLYLEHTAVEDSGYYMCLVNNSVGTERIYTSIIVTSPLSAYISPQALTVDVGETALFNCSTDGHPQDVIIWLKDGKPMEESTRIKFLGTQVLMIESVLRKDRGMFQCVVSNTEESAQGTAQLRIGNAPPIFLSTFKNETLHPGNAWSARCEASGSPAPSISWKLDNKTLELNQRVTVSNRVTGDSVFSYVNISTLQLEDGGYYECVAKNMMGVEVYGARLNIYGPPHIKPMSDHSVVAGRHAEFYCSVVGYPISDIRWEKDGRSLPENHRQVVYPNGTLVLREIQKYADQGGYVCVATSPSGQTAKRKFNVKVMEAPVIDPFTIKQNLQRGMRMHLTCVVSKGDTPVKISWLKDGKEVDINSSLPVAVRAMDDYSSTLVFNDLTTNHTGNYTCMACNEAAVTTYTASIVVHVPPTWLVEPTDSEVAMGQNVSIDCSADGLPTPQIQWKKSLELAHSPYVELREVMRNYMKLGNGTLKILHTRPEDRGYYMCHANNGVESGLSKVVFLTIHVPARFLTPNQNVTAVRGNEAILTCLSEGDKPITITWFREGHQFDPSQHIRITTKEEELTNGLRSLLTVRHVRREDTSMFECLAQNEYGSERMKVQLLVQEPPEAPTNLRVVNFSSRSVNLSWEAPYHGNSPISVYIIQFKNGTDTWKGNVQHVTVAGDQTSSRVTNLQPATTYEFRVVAENTVGASNVSDPVLVSTTEEVPGGPPTDVRVKAKSSEMLVVTWKPPESHLLHGEILGYYIGYRVNDSSEPFHYKTLEVSPGTELLIVLKNLRKFTEYIILVQSYNRAGAGPRSEEVVTTTEEDVPGAPPTDVQCSVVTPQGLTITWSPPPPSEINGVLQGYKVLYKAITDWGDPSPPLEQITRGVKIELFNLEKFCNYSIEVRAFTRKGDGTVSRPIICRTQEDVPSEPADIKALVLDRETILLSWKPPLHPNGVVIKYKVYMRPLDDAGLAKDNFEVSSQETYYTITHLTINLRYEFWVTASTIIGQGPPSRHTVQTPSIYIPAKVASFSDTVIAASKETLQLQCIIVGEPAPERHWMCNGRFLYDDSRVRVNSEGTLVINPIQLTDTGNYSCSAENKHTKDEITYILMVKESRNRGLPSTPYLLLISSSSTSSITLQWRPGQLLGNTVQGYYLSYKREFGEWEKIKLPSDKLNHTLGGLQCGTKYQFFLRAYNQLGMSNPTDILLTRTQGSAPLVPLDTELIRVNSTSILLDLGAWQDGGCPITSLVVEYKLKLDTQWTLVSNNIKFDQIEFSVLDLNPETWYTLRMTAHNSAGSSVTQLDFVTLTSTGATVAPDLIVNSSYGEGRFYNDPGIIIPLVAGVIILIVASVGVYIYIKKKKETFPSNNYGEKSGRSDVTSETALMNVEKKSCVANSSGSTSGVGVSLDGEPISPRETSYLPTPMRVSLGRREDISPYATFRLPMAGGEGSGVGVGAVPDPTDAELSSSLSHRQYIHHAQHCEKLQQIPATYGSCGDSIYTKIHKKPQYQNEAKVSDIFEADCEAEKPHPDVHETKKCPSRFFASRMKKGGHGNTLDDLFLTQFYKRSRRFRRGTRSTGNISRPSQSIEMDDLRSLRKTSNTTEY